MKDKKKKITIKKYGLLDWYVYHFDNYLSFRIIITIISCFIGTLLGILTAGLINQ